jgi:hypothetical protein
MVMFFKINMITGAYDHNENLVWKMLQIAKFIVMFKSRQSQMFPKGEGKQQVF